MYSSFAFKENKHDLIYQPPAACTVYKLINFYQLVTDGVMALGYADISLITVEQHLLMLPTFCLSVLEKIHNF